MEIQEPVAHSATDKSIEQSVKPSIRDQIRQEIEQTPDEMLAIVLEFLLFFKSRHIHPPSEVEKPSSTAASLLNYIGTWQGDDLEECLQLVHDTRGRFYIATDNDEGI